MFINNTELLKCFKNYVMFKKANKNCMMSSGFYISLFFNFLIPTKKKKIKIIIVILKNHIFAKKILR